MAMDHPALLSALARATDALLPLVDGAGAAGALGAVGAPGAAGAEQRLAARGWREADARRRIWSSGELVGQLFPGAGRDGSDHLEVSLVAVPGDVDDAGAEERLDEEFRALFEGGLEHVRRALGPPGLVGAVGQDGFPEEIDAVLVAEWQAGAGGLFLAYMHEDSGLPFRIVAVVGFPGTRRPGDGTGQR